MSVCLVRPSRDGSTSFGKGVTWKRPAHLRSKRLCTSRGTTLIAEALLRDRANAHGNAPQLHEVRRSRGSAHAAARCVCELPAMTVRPKRATKGTDFPRANRNQ